MLQLIGLVVVVAAVGWLLVTLWPVLLFLALCGLVLMVAYGLLLALLPPAPDPRDDTMTMEERIEANRRWMQAHHPEAYQSNQERFAAREAERSKRGY